MNGFLDTQLLLGEIDTAEDQLHENPINKLRDVRGLVSDGFEKSYKPSDIVLNYID